MGGFVFESSSPGPTRLPDMALVQPVAFAATKIPFGNLALTMISVWLEG
jgi:hypothetical protein